MKKGLFSVMDVKSGIFSNPFTSVTVATATRDFSRGCNDSNTDLFQYPEDFFLYHIGEIDDTTGVITPFVQLVNLGSAASFREVKNV